jgi:hypothetical protein
MKLYLVGHPVATALFFGTLAVGVAAEVLQTIRFGGSGRRLSGLRCAP